MERRRFLERVGGITSFALAQQLFPGLSLFARADNIPAGQDHFFVCIEVTGAWDVTLGIDPQILKNGADATDMFLEYRPEDIIEADGLRLGPAAASLKAYASECAIINGISMRADSSHESHLVYMSSGKTGNQAASVAVELGALRGVGPLGVLFNERPYLMSMGSRKVMTTSTADAVRGASSSSSQPTLRAWEEIAGEGELSALEEAVRAAVLGRSSVGDLAKKLQALQNKGTELKPRHILASAFASGAAFQGRINTFTDPALDTHGNHEKTHLQLQKQIWEDIADTFRVFKSTPYKGGSLFDYTTFLVISEFSRLPFLNGARGKDHNPWTNSALLAGRGVQGGQMIGESNLVRRNPGKSKPSKHQATPFNFSTQKVALQKKGSSLIYPENVLRTVLEIYGGAAGATAVNPGTPFLRSALKT